MRVGIIGSGTMGRAHAAGWAKTDAEVVGIATVECGTGEALSAEYGWPCYDSFEAILPEVDVVDLCTPTHLHYAMVMEAARAGKHIMCEKPIALTVAEGKEMIATCRAAGVRLFIAMVVRFFPEFQAAHRSIAAGQVGAPGVIRLTRASYRPQRALDDWFMDPAKSGGMMIDLMIHDFDQARWLAGSDVERVYAHSVTTEHPDIPEDHALVILRFRNGAMAHVEGSWAYPKPMFNYKIEVAGDNGLIEFDNTASIPILFHKHQTAAEGVSDVALASSPLTVDPWAVEVMHFWDALTHDKPFAVTPEDALAALQIALAARESARTGRPVALEPLEVA